MLNVDVVQCGVCRSGVKWVKHITPGPCLKSRLAEQQSQRQTCSKVSLRNFVALSSGPTLKKISSHLNMSGDFFSIIPSCLVKLSHVRTVISGILE